MENNAVFHVKEVGKPEEVWPRQKVLNEFGDLLHQPILNRSFITGVTILNEYNEVMVNITK